jgi:OmpA-OmpF porin, OOP family
VFLKKMFFLQKEVINMRISKLVSLIGLPAVLAIAPFTAAQAQRPGLYLGGAWGAYSIDESALDDNDDLLKAYIGGQFTNWLGIEGSWVDFDRLDRAGNRFEADGKGLAAVFSLPISDTSAIYAKAGQFWWESDSVLGGVAGDRDGNDAFYGAGLNLGFTKHTALRLEWERYDVADIDLDTASVGLQFLF